MRSKTTAGTTTQCILGSLVLTSAALAQPGSPVYMTTWSDCDTSDNKFVGRDGIFHWDVDPNCDIYQRDLYERPMTQTFYATRDRYGAVEYFEYLDITQASAGFDAQFLYVQLDLAGRNHLTSDGTVIPMGMAERYGFRMSLDPDGRFGVLIVSDQPEFKNEPNTAFGPIGTFGYRDTNGDVGGADFDGPTGLTVTKSDNSDEEDGLNGYDKAIISDGRLDDETPVLWVRLNPADVTMVEFALDYGALGFTEDDLRQLGYFQFEASKGGPKDPQNYLFNDKYTKEEAGSPNPGAGGESEFGTEGLKNVYEVDTAVGAAIGPMSVFPPFAVVPVSGVSGVEVTCTDCNFPAGGRIEVLIDDPQLAGVSPTSVDVTGPEFVATFQVTAQAPGATHLHIQLYDGTGQPAVAETTVAVEVAPDIGDDCFFESLTRGDRDRSQLLATLRLFRDNVLTGTPAGRRYVQAYYRYGPELTRILLDHRDLRADLLAILRAYRPILESLAAGATVSLSRNDLKNADAVLEQIGAQADIELRLAIAVVREDLRHGKRLQEFGIRAGRIR